MNTNDIYQSVTDTIIELLEDHQENDFSRPWILMGQDGDFARNPTTGKYYRGINQLLLSSKLLKQNYLNNTWMTFNQISKLGGKVLKGEKSTPIVFYKTAYINENKKYVPVAKAQNMSAQDRGYNKTTKPYRPFTLIYQEPFPSRTDARSREKALKTTAGKRFLRTLINDEN
jgi:antirestriction protein ArdC